MLYQSAHPFFWFSIPTAPRWPLGPRARAAALAGGAVLFWASWPTLATLAGPAPPFLVFGLAAAVGFGMSLLIAIVRGGARPFLCTRPKTLCLVAISLLANNVLYLMAMPKIGPAEANVVAYLWPVLLVAILSFIRREQLGLIRKIGITFGFLGAALAIGPTFERGFDFVGVLLAFSSGLTFAVYAAIRSYARDSHDVIGPSMGLLAVLALGAHYVFEEPANLSLAQLIAVCGIGVAPLTLSNVLWDRATRTGFASTIAGIAYLTPIGSLGFLTVFGVASVTWGAVGGAILVVVGAMAASGLLFKS